jgi:WD40 repeat protein
VTLAPARAAAGAAPATPPDSPYRGLMPYREEDAPFFFGRERETLLITANLRASRLTLLYGASGVGKTSVLRAGVVRGLNSLVAEDLAERRELGEGGRAALSVTYFRSWRDPPLPALLEAVRRSASDALGEELPGVPPGRDPGPVVRGWTERVRYVLVILDQFEDYFLYHPEDADDGGFAEGLARVLNAADLRVNVLISLRDDAWSRLDRFKGRVNHLYDNYLRVDHLDLAAAREAIRRPVEEYDRRLPPGEVPVTIEDGLVEAVLEAEDLRAGSGLMVAGRAPGPAGAAPAHERVETPFLQLVMSRLWAEERAAGSRALRASTLNALGGPRRIVQGHLDHAMAALTPGERAVAADVLQYLVTPSGTKIAHTAGDLARWSKRPQPEVEAALERLCAGDRILRPIEPPAAPGDEGGARARRYELFHDVLAEAVLRWLAVQEGDRRLAAARRRTLRWIAIAAAALAVGAGLAVAAILAVRAEDDAQSQRGAAISRQLAASATAQLGLDPDLSVLLAKQAWGRGHTDEAENALRQAVQADRVRAVLDADASVVYSAAFTPDARRVVSAGRDGAIRLWDRTSRREIRRVDARQGQLYAARPSPGGQRVVSAGSTGTVKVWALGGARPLATLRGHRGAVYSAAFSPDGRRVVSAGGDGTARVWDWRSGRILRVMRTALQTPAPGAMRSAAFDPTGRLVAIGSDDGIEVRDWATGRVGGTYQGNQGPVYAVAFSRDGRRVAAAADDGTIRIWDWRHDRRLSALLRGHRGFVTSVAFSRDGRLVVSSGLDGTVQVADVGGRTLAVLAGHHGAVRTAAFSRDGRLVVSAGVDGEVRVWDWAAGASTLTVPRARAPLLAVDFDPGGSRAVSAASDGAVRIWDLTRRRAVSAFYTGKPATGAAFVPGTRLVASSSGDGTVRVASLDPLRQVAILGTGVVVHAVDPSPDGRLIAAPGRDGVVRVWDWRARRVVARLDGDGDARAAVFTPDGASLVVGRDGRVGSAEVWDWRAGRIRARLRLPGEYVTAVDVSPDGREVAVAADGGLARVWDWRARTPPRRLVGHRGPLYDARFNRDGTRLVTSGVDGTVRVWDWARAQPIAVFSGQEGSIRSAAFSPRGRRVLSAADDGTLGLYDCETCGSVEDVLRLADARVPRSLTPEERDTFIP